MFVDINGTIAIVKDVIGISIGKEAKWKEIKWKLLIAHKNQLIFYNEYRSVCVLVKDIHKVYDVKLHSFNSFLFSIYLANYQHEFK